MRKIILIGVLPPPYSGQSIAFKVLVDYIGKTNIPYKTINISGSRSSAIKPLAILLRGYDYIFTLTRLFFGCLFSKNLVYVQVAQSKNGFRRDVWINRISKWFDSKIIGHMHGGNFNGFYESQDAPTQSKIKSELLNYEKMIVLSDNLKSMYDFQPLIHNRIVCIPNGIDRATEQPAKAIRTARQINILYLSNLIESKGYLVVLDSLQLLKQANISFSASFCGEFYIAHDETNFKNPQEARNDFFDKIKTYDLVNEVSFKGVVTGTEKQALLEAAHFFILPTKYINEGQPISIIEAMRTGCIVIATNYRAIPEMIAHGKTGFLLQHISAVEIAGYVSECVNNPGLFTDISNNAKESYNLNFTEAIHGERMLALIRECSDAN